MTEPEDAVENSCVKPGGTVENSGMEPEGIVESGGMKSEGTVENSGMEKDGSRYSSIEQELREGRSVTYFTIGVSMKPLLLERKTHVMIAPLDKAKDGDILLYIRKKGIYVLHRCIRQDEEYYYMRGDNTYVLECIKKELAVGVVTHIYRKGKWFDVRTNKFYRGYVMFWQGIYPLRLVLWKLKRRISR